MTRAAPLHRLRLCLSACVVCWTWGAGGFSADLPLPESEADALNAIRSAFPPAALPSSWTTNTSTTTSTSACEWVGVECDCTRLFPSPTSCPTTDAAVHNNHVVGLTLAHTATAAHPLAGALPRQVLGLGELRHLDLSANALTGSLDGLVAEAGVVGATLARLEVLDVGHNQLAGSLPPALLASLPSLRVLGLSGNALSGTVPEAWCGFSLVSLELDANPGLCGELPSCLSNATTAALGECPAADGAPACNVTTPDLCAVVVHSAVVSPTATLAVTFPLFVASTTTTTSSSSSSATPNTLEYAWGVVVVGADGSEALSLPPLAVPLDSPGVVVNATTRTAQVVVGDTDGPLASVLQAPVALANNASFFLVLTVTDPAFPWAPVSLSSALVAVDANAPAANLVVDGASCARSSSPGVITARTARLSACWEAFTERETVVVAYRYRVVGVRAVDEPAALRTSEVVGWTEVGAPHAPRVSVTTAAVAVDDGTTYRFEIQATDAAGNVGTATSPGVFADLPENASVVVPVVVAIVVAVVVVGLVGAVVRRRLAQQGSRESALLLEEKVEALRSTLQHVTAPSAGADNPVRDVVEHADDLGVNHLPEASIKDAAEVAFVFTDIEGSTLMSEANPELNKHIQMVHDSVVQEAISACCGYQINTQGDAFELAFLTIADACIFALRVQRRLMSAVWHPGVQSMPKCGVELDPTDGEVVLAGPRVRMGIHWAAKGTFWRKFHDLTKHCVFGGDAFHVAREVGDLAHGGQILMTAEAFAKLRVRRSLRCAGFPAVDSVGAYYVSGLKAPRGQAHAQRGRVLHLFQLHPPIYARMKRRRFGLLDAPLANRPRGLNVAVPPQKAHGQRIAVVALGVAGRVGRRRRGVRDGDKDQESQEWEAMREMAADTVLSVAQMFQGYMTARPDAETSKPQLGHVHSDQSTAGRGRGEGGSGGGGGGGGVAWRRFVPSLNLTTSGLANPLHIVDSTPQVLFVLVFPTVSNAVRFCLAAQVALLYAPWSRVWLREGRGGGGGGGGGDDASTAQGTVCAADGALLFRGPRVAMAVHVGSAYSIVGGGGSTHQGSVVSKAPPRPGSVLTDHDIPRHHSSAGTASSRAAAGEVWPSDGARGRQVGQGVSESILQDDDAQLGVVREEEEGEGEDEGKEGEGKEEGKGEGADKGGSESEGRGVEAPEANHSPRGEFSPQPTVGSEHDDAAAAAAAAVGPNASVSNPSPPRALRRVSGAARVSGGAAGGVGPRANVERDSKGSRAWQRARHARRGSLGVVRRNTVNNLFRTRSSAVTGADRIGRRKELKYTGPLIEGAMALCRVTHGGQILLSEDAWAAACDSLPPYTQVVNLGHHSVLVGEGGRSCEMSLMELSPLRLCERAFPPVRSLRCLGAGYRQSPSIDKGVAIVFCRVHKPEYPPNARTDAVFGEAVAMWSSLCRRLLPQFDGYECKEPDPGKFTLAFQDARMAVAFCCTAQRELLGLQWSKELLALEGCGEARASWEGRPSMDGGNGNGNGNGSVGVGVGGGRVASASLPNIPEQREQGQGQGEGEEEGEWEWGDDAGVGVGVGALGKKSRSMDRPKEDDGVLMWRGLRVHMGMAFGHPTFRKPLQATGRADYFGAVPNLAARVLGQAYAGQVLFEAEAAQLGVRWTDRNTATMHPALPGTEAIRLRSVGLCKLKGIEAEKLLVEAVVESLRLRRHPHPKNFTRHAPSNALTDRGASVSARSFSLSGSPGTVFGLYRGQSSRRSLWRGDQAGGWGREGSERGSRGRLVKGRSSSPKEKKRTPFTRAFVKRESNWQIAEPMNARRSPLAQGEYDL